MGRWIAFIAVVLRLFFPRHFPGIFLSHQSHLNHISHFAVPFPSFCHRPPLLYSYNVRFSLASSYQCWIWLRFGCLLSYILDYKLCMPLCKLLCFFQNKKINQSIETELVMSIPIVQVSWKKTLNIYSFYSKWTEFSLISIIKHSLWWDTVMPVKLHDLCMLQYFFYTLLEKTQR